MSNNTDLKKQMLQFITKENDFTHTSMSGGLYKISDEQNNIFMMLISKYEIHDITEKHLQDQSPIIFDFDFKLKNQTRLITNDILENIVFIINEYIDEMFINPNKTCFIMMRDNPYKSNSQFNDKTPIYKDGIHIIYPYIVTNYNYIYGLRDALLIGLQTLENISETKIYDIIDKAVIKSNNWLMYGGNKPNIKATPYKVIKIYNSNLIEIPNTLTKYDLIKLLSIRNENITLTEPRFIYDYNDDEKCIELTNDDKNQINNIPISKNKIRYLLLNLINISRSNNYSSWINIGLCLHNINHDYLDLWIEFSKRSNKYKDGECEKIWRKFKVNDKGLKFGSLYYYSEMDNKDKIKDLKVFDALENVEDTFPNNKLIINKILRDNNYIFVDLLDKYCPIMGNNHETNLNFIEMSPKGGIIMKCRCDKCIGKIFPNDRELVIDITNQKNLFNITINNYNYINNPDDEEDELKFEGIILNDDNELNNLLIESLRYSNGNAHDIAQILFYLYKNDFRYDITFKCWYYYTNYWTKNNTKLKTKISNEIYEIYKLARFRLLKNKIKNIKNSSEITPEHKMSLRIKNLLPKLKDSHFKSNIMTEAIEIFSDYCNNFADILNTNKYLIGFNNGVYDFNSMQFRKGKYYDYISMTVDYEYFDNTSNYFIKEKENKLNNFLQEIQPDDKQLKYLLKILASCLVGENVDHIFTVLLGKGRNGKSKLNDLLAVTFGNYYSSFNTKLLTRPRTDANTPDPNILSMKNVRIIVGSEPEKNDELNTGYIKLMSGQDKARTRACYSNDMIEFTFQFKMILLCNEVPKVDNPNDEAFWIRFKCINFPTMFVDEPKNTYEKKINTNLQIEELNMYFMLLLIEHYKLYKLEGIKTVESVKQITNNIKISNNICLEFMQNNTETDNNNNIHTSHLYEVFINWFKQNYPIEKPPSNKLFKKNIEKYYPYKDNVPVSYQQIIKKTTGIINIKFKNNNEYVDNIIKKKNNKTYHKINNNNIDNDIFTDSEELII